MTKFTPKFSHHPAQVNSEVKRLLVASVGEDIEARVDFLTQVRIRELNSSSAVRIVFPRTRRGWQLT